MMSETRTGGVGAITIRRWDEITHRARLDEELDHIFFEASGTKAFANDAARAMFRERWLGRYLKLHPQWAYLAVADHGAVAGYLVGALDEGSGFEDFTAAARQFPAHLHVNLAPQFRSRGIGAALIEKFAAAAVDAGAPGMHVVTSADARNVHFYERVGFSRRARTTVNGRELVFLGRALHGGDVKRH